MENNLKLDAQQIVVVQGSIEFNEYDYIKKQAVSLSEQIKTVEVSEENIKESKKLLAAVNKRLKELEDKRISVKRTMLEPYQVFEEQVKEIVSIVKEADAAVRDQVKYLEEFERLQKEDEVKNLFEKRKNQYKALHEVVEFQRFLQPKHLNKTTSIAAIEKEMVEWLEHINNDIQAIQAMNNAKEVLSVYIGVYDLAKAISQVNDRERSRQAAEASGVLEKSEVAKNYLFIVYGEKDFTLAKMLLDQNKIKFDVKEGF
jgi:Protein of unknown function (DUF1351)